MTHFFDHDGVKLAYEVTGSGPPILWLHGFTGSSKSWEELVSGFESDYSCVRVDITGHGQSDAPSDWMEYRMERIVERLLGLMAHLDAPRFSCIGYSMGARIALGLASTYPSTVHCLVLESGSPGLEDEAARLTRRMDDEALASSIEAHGIAWFVQRWEQTPLFQSQSQCPSAILAKQRAIRLAQSAHGLAGSLRGIGTGVQPSLWGKMSQLTMPVALITGDLDVKFTQIAQRMVNLQPGIHWMSIPGAGHTVHLERPDAYLRVVKSFVDRNAAGNPSRSQGCDVE